MNGRNNMVSCIFGSLDCIIKKGLYHNQLTVGKLSTVYIEASEIADILKKKRATVSSSLKELKKLGLIHYNSQERKKITEVRLDVAFFSFFNLEGLKFDFGINKNFSATLKKAKGNKKSFIKSISMTKEDCENLQIPIQCSNKPLKEFGSFFVENPDLPSIVILRCQNSEFLNSKMNFEGMFEIDSESPVLRNDEAKLSIYRQNCRFFMHTFVHKNIIYNIKENNINIYNTNKCCVEKPQKLSIYRQNCRFPKDSFLETGNFITSNSESEASMNNRSEFVSAYKGMNKKQEPPKSKDLFVTKTDEIEYSDILHVNRSPEEIPPVAFKADDWYNFVRETYRSTRDSVYSGNKIADRARLVDKTYPLVFGQEHWSARDFKKFLIEQIREKNKKGQFVKFGMGWLHDKNNLRLAQIQDFTRRQKDIRERDIFERVIYIQHFPISSNKNDLFEAIKFNENYPLGLLLNYGIVNYHRFLQKNKTKKNPQGMNMEEAAKAIGVIIKREILNRFLKSDSEMARKILTEIARTTTLWEPHVDSPKKRSAKVVIDWRRVYWKTWIRKVAPSNPHSWDITLNSWWEDCPNYAKKRLSCVKSLYNTRGEN